MATLGAQIVSAKTLETLRLLQGVDADDVGVLDEAFGEWMGRPLGREALASVVLPSNGSLYLALMNFEPAGLLLMTRGEVASQIRALMVAEDMRRRGLARTMLETADDLAREVGLAWLWMSVPNGNVPATACALACGYRRYRPQFMHRERAGLVLLGIDRAHVEPLTGDDVKVQLTHWIARCAEQGDAWCSELAKADLLKTLLPALQGSGPTCLLVSGTDEVGVAHIADDQHRRRVWLWLDRRMWNSEGEMNVLKCVLDVMADAPSAIDIEFGSHGHLRASVARYKALGFKPVVRERVVMARQVP